ncbi:metallopeptidase family protein [Aquabacter sp. L1I39]|uniref:metallopeptidase family protein n=1 Tax=Aquabacter sp. L1I39 TaxID=2820278 RepID=UPI001ADA7511|nr:metallopeptidase family protein [Aquabacter sp. L1I39]QTL04349.1 metallopeptidase family protein [Aquabacter sp. L1I39]
MSDADQAAIELTEAEVQAALDWSPRAAPSLADFEVIADEAFARLPEDFRRLCAGVIIKVDDFPTEDVLDEMEAETPFDLLGLFQGIGLAQDAAVTETGRMPNLIHLYRRPILDYWAEHEDSLGAVITHVLVHEIGHHFGLSDEDMERIEAEALDE